MVTKKWRCAPLALAIVVLGGCVINQPKTAEEFRKAIEGATFGKVEKFEVDRPFNEVAQTFKKMAPRCLNVRIKSSSGRPGRDYHSYVSQYNPTVIVKSKKAELHLQREYVSGVINPSKPPKGGYYILVVDAFPAGDKKARVALYGSSVGYGTLNKAVKGWATGENIGCPDLTD